MHPAIYEALILALMGSSGVAIGLLLGVRQIIPLATLALAFTTVLRVWTGFLVWSLDRPEWTTESWALLSSVALIGGVAFRWREWKLALKAGSVFGGLSLAALGTKYVLDIGERHHSDSGNVLGVAIIAIQGETGDLDPIAGSFKRGIAFPLMLSLGPDGRILSSFTPLVFLVTIVLVLWLAKALLPPSIKPRTFAVVGIAVLAFSFSVPIFRAAFFYLNGHTLMAFGLLLLLGAFLLSRKSRRFDALPSTMALLGGAIGATARIEGVALVIVLLVALAGESWWSSPEDRVRFGAVVSLSGLSLSWWLSSLESPVLERFGLSSVTMVGLSLVGGFVAASRFIDSIRSYLFPVFVAAIGVTLFVLIWQSHDPLWTVFAQWPNLGLGRGGWGTAAYAFVGSVVLLGLRGRSDTYRWLLVLVLTTIGTIFLTKSFDGGAFTTRGFGGAGFFDSLNRMWLHVLPGVLLMTVIGYSELLSKVTRRERDANHRRELAHHSNLRPKR